MYLYHRSTVGAGQPERPPEHAAGIGKRAEAEADGGRASGVDCLMLELGRCHGANY
jgi:hypothetical protein